MSIQNLEIPTQVGEATCSQVRAALSAQITKNYHCLFLDTFYNQFLINLYEQEPQFKTENFSRQLKKIIETNNGDSDFYSAGLRNCGWKAEQIVINSPFMQAAWARENNTKAVGELLILEQAALLKPDVIYCQDTQCLSEALLIELKKHCRLLVGQIAASITKVPIHRYDVIISSILPLVEHCRSIGITAQYVPLAFAQRVSQGLDLPTDYTQRSINCSFIGSVASEVHQERVNLLSYLTQKIPIQIWGTGIDKLPVDSPIRAHYQAEAWGADLFRLLGHSKITVNCHGEVMLTNDSQKSATEDFANNMRLFEATGMGALLITDYRDNLSDLFEIGKEIVVYRSYDECAALIKYYLERPEKACAIAKAGQVRTLKDHSYGLRMQSVSAFLKRLLLCQEEKHATVDYQKISFDYKNVATNEISVEHTQAWQSSSISVRQRALVHHELSMMYKGEIALPFKSLKEVFSRIHRSADSIVEIGCSSGYYYEVFSYLLTKRFSYTGVDYSKVMIDMAKSYYPEVPFHVESGDDLPFADHYFDIGLSGCVLLHCPNYAEHIAETARVTKRVIILSRTPITRTQPTQYFTKKAYEVETVELVFNEAEIINLVLQQGFRLTHFIVLDSNQQTDQHTVTYAFERIN